VTDERCPNCGQVIPGDIPGGQCPTCLVRLALDLDGSGDASTFDVTDSEPLNGSIGPYRLVRKLGHGGMGLVYLADQTAPIRRLVAVKVMKPGMESQEVLARFESERQALALLQHPGIAAIYDAGTTSDGQPFFAMEYVPGLPITRYCDLHRLAIGTRVELFLQVCGAITHAHQKGIIHRDLKPSNLLVTQQNDQPLVKVIDFGVAKAVSQRLTERTLFTQQGVVLGTPEYMSPEQAGATVFDVDTRSDIYSLGVVLFELLAGVRPFEADDLRTAALVEVLRVIREEMPPRLTARFSSMAETTAAKIARQRNADIRSLASQLRGDLEWITLRSLEKEPAQRYASASELAGDLQRYLLDEPVTAGPPRLSYRLGKFVRKHRAAVAALLAIVIALAVGLAASVASLVRARDAMGLAQRRSYAANVTAAFLGLQAHSVRETWARLRQADPSLRGWEWHHLSLAADTSVGRFGDGSTVRAIDFDASGALIIWDAVESLRSVELASGREVRSTTIPSTLLGRSLDGRRAILVKMPSMFDKSAPRQFTPGPPEIRDLHSGRTIARLNAYSMFLHPALVSPDAERIVLGNRLGEQRLALIDANNGREIARLNLPKLAQGAVEQRHRRLPGFAFSADGRRLAACQASVLRQWDAVTGRELVTSSAKSQPVAPLPEPVRPPGPTVSPMGLPGVLGTVVGDGDEVAAMLAYTTDDTRLLCFDETDTVTEWDAATGRVLAAWHAQRLGKPLAISPDGSRIAWAVGERILIADVRTADVRADLLGHGATIRTAAFSPDGRRLASGAVSGAVRLWDTTVDRAVTTIRSDAPLVTSIAFHPDGRQLGAGGILNTLEIWDLESRRVRTLPGHHFPIVAVAMTPDGRTLISGGQDGTIHRWDLTKGRPVQSMRDPRERALQAIAVDPRGQRVVSVAQDSSVCVWDSATGALVSRLSGGERPVVSLAYSPDGSRFAAGEESGAVTVWNTSTWQPLYRRQAQTGRISTLAFSPSSARLAVGSDNATIRVLDASNGLERGPLMAHESRVTGIAYSPDGRRLVSGAADAAVRVWDVTGGDLLLTLRHQAPVTSVAFSQDGRRVGASSLNGVILVWNTLPERERPSDR
jgi:WD40 repeat protein/serine/threonine protein kinase